MTATISDKDRLLLAERFTEDRPLLVHVITLSDRASKGEYEDKSGPLLKGHVEDFFKDAGIPTSMETIIIPDDGDALERELHRACAKAAALIFTTGGTGVGPRDITPDVVTALSDRLIPGVMDHIRLKYGSEKPNALLSRSVTATIGTTLIYTLPGSTKAVNEYMTEIVRTLPHLICTLHGLAVH